MTAATAQIDFDAIEPSIPEERRQLGDMTAKFLLKNWSQADLHRLMESETGFDPGSWRSLVEETGLNALRIPESFGGTSLSPNDMLPVMEEMGRVLFCGPFFSTAVMSVELLLASSDKDMQARLLPDLASGRSIATLAIDEQGGGAMDKNVAIEAVDTAAGYLLHGEKTNVIDGLIADKFLVLASVKGRPSFFLVPNDRHNLDVSSLPSFDLTRRLAKLTFCGVKAELIGEAGEGLNMLALAMPKIIAAMAGEQLGGAQRCMDMAVEYAKSRVQFGRPIGSFQAIKHKCADMVMALEAARSAAVYVAACATTNSPALPVAACMAKSACAETYYRVAAENMQIHGGIGFTWEHECHLHLKRAKSSELMFGDPTFHRQRLARLLNITNT